jgi:diaminohydroxyphosphoribosylaminopyrimidine deaminase/5-amino-6-(5-phosphoribosylamino)uracil reductase
VAAGIVRVVSAMADPNPLVAGAGHWRLAEQGITVEVGVGADEAKRDHAGHIQRILNGRPHVMLKLAVSADRKVGLSGRRPAAITGEVARERVHLMRAMNDAVLTGIGTVIADDPLLTCRLPGMAERSPVRVVLDSVLRLSPESRLAASARVTPLWVLCSDAASRAHEHLLRARGVKVFRLATTGGRLDLAAVLKLLADRGITRLMVEAGPIVSAAFVSADLVDAAALFRSPDPIGADGLDALDDLPLDALTHSPQLVSIGTETVGADTVETFERP